MHTRTRKKVSVYDSGEDAPFTACQGMPGDILKSAGAISIFNDIEAGWATPSWEEVVERDPDAILLLDYDGDVEEKAEISSHQCCNKRFKGNQRRKNLFCMLCRHAGLCRISSCS